MQAVGGTGGLKVGADFLQRIAAAVAQVWISEPSWENHRALFEGAGFTVNAYPYYDPKTRGLDFAGMQRALEALPAGSDRRAARVLPQPDRRRPDARATGARCSTSCARAGSCRSSTSPTRASPRASRPTRYAARLFAESVSPVFLSSSFSKSFSLYGERVGALSVVTASPDEAARVLSNVKRIVRTIYSNPPTHGSQIVATVLSNPQLRALWDRELGAMRDRIKAMRKRLVDSIHARVPDANFGFVLQQRGMFSYSGLTREQVRAAARGVLDLRDRHRPHLRRRAQQQERRLRRRRDREGHPLAIGSRSRPRGGRRAPSRWRCRFPA